MYCNSNQFNMILHNFQEFIDLINKYGDQIAITAFENNQNRTYTQLVNDIDNIANNLASQIRPGHRVLLFKLGALDWVRSFLAVTICGGIAVSLDSRVSDKMLKNAIELTKPFLAICSQADEIVNLKTLVIDSLLLNADSRFNKTLGQDPNLPCQVIFTSGTWSLPKGVTLSQTNILSNLCEIVNHVYCPKNGERFLSILPPSHIYEQVIGLLVPLSCGAHITCLGQITPTSFREALLLTRPNSIVAVPRILEMMQKSIFKQLTGLLNQRRLIKLSAISRKLPIKLRRIMFSRVHSAWGNNLQTFFVGGAPITTELDSFFQGLGVNVNIGYGMSETSPLIAGSLNQNRQKGSVGKVLQNFEIKLNQDSEIEVRGPSVFLGYWPKIIKDEKAFFNTQDVGRFDTEGNLILKGRSKNLIVYPSGDKIFAEDIEYLALMNPNVEEVCLVNLDSNIPKLILVYVGRVEDQTVFLQELQKQLPIYVKIQKMIMFGDSSLPKTHTLKTDRKQIQDWVIKLLGNK